MATAPCTFGQARRWRSAHAVWHVCLFVAAILIVGAPAATAARPSEPFPISPESATGVHIPRGEQRAVYLKMADGTQRRILTVAQLPQKSRGGIGIAAQTFSSAALAPDRTRVAFATLGRGWAGLLDLKDGRIAEFLVFFEGHASELAWAPDAHFIVLTDHGPSGLREVGIPPGRVTAGVCVSTRGLRVRPGPRSHGRLAGTAAG